VEVFVTGINNTTAPVEVREKFHFPPERVGEAFKKLEEIDLSECVFISTCNRVELCLFSPDAEAVKIGVRRFFGELHGNSQEALEGMLFHFSGEAAVRHLFSVASSIKSVVIGEGQILGQVKKAFFYARDNGHTSNLLNKLFNDALACGKRARAETEIGRGAVSVSQAAVELARQIFGSLKKRTVLIIGAGKMSELAVKHLKKGSVGQLLFSNRSPEKAEKMAQIYGGVSVSLDRKTELIAQSDIVISSTSSEGFVISPEEIKTAMAGRNRGDLFLIDLAVPRDVNPEVEKISSVFLYTVDDLEKVVQANLGRRGKEIGEVEKIVDKALVDFSSWLSKAKVLPTVETLKSKIDGYRDAVVEQMLKKALKKPDGEKVNSDLIHKATSKIVDKLVREVLAGSKECRTDSDWKSYNEGLNRIFNLGK